MTLDLEIKMEVEVGLQSETGKGQLWGRRAPKTGGLGSVLEVGLRIVLGPNGSRGQTSSRAQFPSHLIRSPPPAPRGAPGWRPAGVRSGGCSAPTSMERPLPKGTATVNLQGSLKVFAFIPTYQTLTETWVRHGAPKSKGKSGPRVWM